MRLDFANRTAAYEVDGRDLGVVKAPLPEGPLFPAIISHTPTQCSEMDWFIVSSITLSHSAQNPLGHRQLANKMSGKHHLRWHGRHFFLIGRPPQGAEGVGGTVGP